MLKMNFAPMPNIKTFDSEVRLCANKWQASAPLLPFFKKWL